MLGEIKEAGTFKSEKIISSAQSSHIMSTKGNDTKKSFPVINMCANNYLGWCNHSEIVKAAVEATKMRGAGLSSVRFICGTQVRRRELLY